MSHVCPHGSCRGRAFNSHRDLNKHLETHHNDSKNMLTTTDSPAFDSYTAGQKGFITTGVEFMSMSSDLKPSDSEVFSKTYTDSTSWECAKCNEVFDDCRQLGDHAKECLLTELLYQCSDCKRKFKYLSSLYEHVDETQCKHEKTILGSTSQEQRSLINGSEYEAVLYFDGAARVDSGKGGGGLILQDAFGKTIENRSINIFHSDCTKDQAVYCALIKGLQVASSKGIKHLLVLGDVEVVINQMTALYDISITEKGNTLGGLNRFANRSAAFFNLIDFRWIPERENIEADQLAELGVRRQGSHEQLTLIS